MSIDNVSLRSFTSWTSHTDALFPVLAYECEVSPSSGEALDAYEVAVMRFIKIGLGSSGIAHALNATESLVDTIISGLATRDYLQKKPHKPWELSEKGKRCLIEGEQQEPGKESVFGFMFVSALRKDVLPCFIPGPIDKLPPYIGPQMENKLVLKDEAKTFADFQRPKRYALENAYVKFLKIQQIAEMRHNNEISQSEAEDCFAQLESFDEADTLEEPVLKEQKSLKEKNDTEHKSDKSFVRLLKKDPIALYLQLKIIFDYKQIDGYRILSPFDMNDVDDDLYFRQIQWMISNGDICIGDEPLSDFLSNEIHKFSLPVKIDEVSYNVFILHNLPLLAKQKKRFEILNIDLEHIYSMIQKTKLSLIEMESVVGALNRKILEKLLNDLFRTIPDNDRFRIAESVKRELQYYTCDYDVNNYFWDRIPTGLGLSAADVPRNGQQIKNIVSHLQNRRNTQKSNGNSTIEKMINLMILKSRISSREVNKYFSGDKLAEHISSLNRLNDIRNKTSHDASDSPFTEQDYKDYMALFFDVASRLFDAFSEN